MKTLVIIGAGGMGRELVDMMRESNRSPYENFAFVDDTVPARTVVHGVRVIGNRLILGTMAPGSVKICVAHGDPAKRLDLLEDIRRYGHPFATIIDPSAQVSSTATIGEGVIICARALINCDVTVGAHAVIYVGAILGHDVSIGRNAFIGPNAVINGGVHVGEGVLVGAGATVYPGKTIGNWSKVGMGAAVYSRVDDRTTVMGNPARVVGYGRKERTEVAISTSTEHKSPEPIDEPTECGSALQSHTTAEVTPL